MSSTITPIGNPQGKGLVTSLESLGRVPANVPPPKNLVEILKDYLVGSLVLSSEFKFVPVPGKDYFLYFYRGHWQLSLVSPKEWRGERDKYYVCRALLLPDATWEIGVSQGLKTHPELLLAVEEFCDKFVANLQVEKPMQEGLSFYQSELSYYPRVYAYALSRSLNQSLSVCEGASQPLALAFGGQKVNALSLLDG